MSRKLVAGDQVIALFSSNAEDARELSFQVSQVLTVVEAERPQVPGWVKCKLGSKIGLVPVNYVNLFTQEPTVREAAYANVHSYENVTMGVAPSPQPVASPPASSANKEPSYINVPMAPMASPGSPALATPTRSVTMGVADMTKALSQSSLTRVNSVPAKRATDAPRLAPAAAAADFKTVVEVFRAKMVHMEEIIKSSGNISEGIKGLQVSQRQFCEACMRSIAEMSTKDERMLRDLKFDVKSCEELVYAIEQRAKALGAASNESVLRDLSMTLQQLVDVTSDICARINKHSAPPSTDIEKDGYVHINAAPVNVPSSKKGYDMISKPAQPPAQPPVSTEGAYTEMKPGVVLGPLADEQYTEVRSSGPPQMHAPPTQPTLPSTPATSAEMQHVAKLTAIRQDLMRAAGARNVSEISRLAMAFVGEGFMGLGAIEATRNASDPRIGQLKGQIQAFMAHSSKPEDVTMLLRLSQQVIDTMSRL